MKLGRVYLWTLDPENPLGGSVRASVVPLEHLDDEHGVRGGRLTGRFVRVRNASCVNVSQADGREVSPVPIGDAVTNADGDFLFEPGRGGGRVDKVLVADADFLGRYVEAAHFGEVNTYYHVDRIAAYVDELLRQLKTPSLPQVTVVVNAHHAAIEMNGIRDGVCRGRSRIWGPFQGGHYRLPSRKYNVMEYEPLSPDGEIHIGPGRRLLHHGALVEAAGGRYRANASHNAGIIYHEYGHHIVRHTADLRANRLRSPERQDNRKTALDEGTCDYLTATMLGVPHIWAWHRRHDHEVVHPRSLVSSKTMADFDAGPKADPHANGTIWASALWDFRTRLVMEDPEGARRADLIVLKSLLLLGELFAPMEASCQKATRRLRNDFGVALNSLLQADEVLYAGRHSEEILTVFASRGIVASADDRGIGAESVCQLGQ